MRSKVQCETRSGMTILVGGLAVKWGTMVEGESKFEDLMTADIAKEGVGIDAKEWVVL